MRETLGFTPKKAAVICRRCAMDGRDRAEDSDEKSHDSFSRNDIDASVKTLGYIIPGNQ
jgi:hypothetical protein